METLSSSSCSTIFNSKNNLGLHEKPNSATNGTKSSLISIDSVLVTGGCGFIGSNFINYIFEKWPNSRIVNFDKLAIDASPKHIIEKIRFSNRYVFVKGNLLNQSLVLKTLKKYKIDTVIHFAAITHVDESYNDRIGTIQENVISTTTLLEALNTYGKLKKLVHISTDEVYGDSRENEKPKTENSLPNPTNPYAASKAACEMIVRSYYHSYKLPYVIVRMNNVYGPRQSLSKLIPKFVQLALEHKPYPLMGDGLHSRSWMYVDDCAKAIQKIAEHGRLGEIYNIGTNFEKCNLHLTEMIHQNVEKMLQRKASEIELQPIADRPYHDRRYHIDFSKIYNEFGWRCEIPFEEGLSKTLEYYVNNYMLKQKNVLLTERETG